MSRKWIYHKELEAKIVHASEELAIGWAEVPFEAQEEKSEKKEDPKKRTRRAKVKS